MELTTLQIAMRCAERTCRRWKINRLHKRSVRNKLNRCRDGHSRLITTLTIHFSKNCYENNRLTTFFRFFTTMYYCETARFPLSINRCILCNGFGSPIDLNVKPMFVRSIERCRSCRADRETNVHWHLAYTVLTAVYRVRPLDVATKTLVNSNH